MQIVTLIKYLQDLCIENCETQGKETNTNYNKLNCIFYKNVQKS